MHCVVELNFLKNSPRQDNVLCYNSVAKALMEISETSYKKCRLKEAAGCTESAPERKATWPVTSMSNWVCLTKLLNATLHYNYAIVCSAC